MKVAKRLIKREIGIAQLLLRAYLIAFVSTMGVVCGLITTWYLVGYWMPALRHFVTGLRGVD